jgi:predicted ATPase
LVEGVPLCIELAASWLRLLPCKEIVAEIEQGLDFLTTLLQNVPERHRSLRAVFDYSWDLLSPAEQEVVRQLAVFRGSFRREAAAQVVGASLPMLAGLVDKSLLRRDAAGRYEIHDLLRQYAEEKLQADPAENERVHDAHCRYYAELMVQHQAELKGEELSAALKVLNVERENVRAAWNWAVGHRRAAELDMFMDCL